MKPIKDEWISRYKDEEYYYRWDRDLYKITRRGACCDCGLAHEFTYRLIFEGRLPNNIIALKVSGKRDEKSTKLLRKARKFDFVRKSKKKV